MEMNSGSLLRCWALSVPQMARALFRCRFLHIRCSRPRVGNSVELLYIEGAAELPRIVSQATRTSVLKDSSSCAKYQMFW